MSVPLNPVRMVAPVLMESMDTRASVWPATLVPLVRQVAHILNYLEFLPFIFIINKENTSC